MYSIYFLYMCVERESFYGEKELPIIYMLLSSIVTWNFF